MKALRGLSALAIALFGLSSAARADITADFVSISAPVAGVYTYTYHLAVGSQQTANPGAFMTLYDITGLIPGSVTDPTGFTHTVQAIGITPTDPTNLTPVIPDTALLNITFTKGSGSLVGPSADLPFTFQSTQGTLNTGLTFFAGQAIETEFPTRAAENIGTTIGPAVIPEPSVTVMVGLVGLLGLGYRKLHPSRKAA